MSDDKRDSVFLYAKVLAENLLVRCLLRDIRSEAGDVLDDVTLHRIKVALGEDDHGQASRF